MSKITKSIEAEFVSGSEEDVRSNCDRVECPVCSKEVIQRELETYWPEEQKVSVDICCDCRGDYERGSGNDLDADVIEDRLFESLYAWMVDNIEIQNNDSKTKVL